MTTILVVAKAPVPGLAKTRIARTIGADAAAELAAAALLDTLDVVAAVGSPGVVAMTGDLDRAARSAEIRTALAPFRVVPQRGDSFDERLAHAHADAAVAGGGVVQVGMDTPHVTAADYRHAVAAVERGERVIGPALDGGWWLIGLPDPAVAAALIGVPMSTDDTGALTEAAIGGRFTRLGPLLDMDTWDDARAIAADAPGTRLAAAVAAVREEVAS